MEATEEARRGRVERVREPALPCVPVRGGGRDLVAIRENGGEGNGRERKETGGTRCGWARVSTHGWAWAGGWAGQSVVDWLPPKTFFFLVFLLLFFRNSFSIIKNRFVHQISSRKLGFD